MRFTSAKSRILLAFGAFVIGLCGTLLVLRAPMEPLTREGLAAARQRWRERGPADYRLTFASTEGEYQVEVEGGVVVSLRLDGRDSQTADPSLYSMDGLFRLLEMELDIRETSGEGGAMLMRVHFDPQTGGLKRYLRTGGPGGRVMIRDVSVLEASLNGGHGI